MKKSSNILARTAHKSGNLCGGRSAEACSKTEPYRKGTWPPKIHTSTSRSMSNVDDGKDRRGSSRQYLSGQSSDGGKERAPSSHRQLNGTSKQQRHTETKIKLEANREQLLSGSVAKQERKETEAQSNGPSDGEAVETRRRRGYHWSGSAVRRYALYRSMLKTSAQVNPNTSESERGRFCPVTQRRESGRIPEMTSPEQPTVQVSPPPRTDLPLIIDEDEPLADYTRGFDLKGTMFPKRIYIREYVNDAIVDELVDVRNQEDWELLTYMAPLRPIKRGKTKKSRDLRFQDLCDFDVYYYPFHWRYLSD